MILRLLLLAAALHAQITTGEILGLVLDGQGLRVAGAELAVRNESTGEAYRVRSNQAGEYLARALPPGPYSLAVECAGFKRYSRGGLALAAGQALRIDVRLEVGPVSEIVQVKAETPQVNVTTSALETLADGRRLHELPLPARNVLSVAGLEAGVTRVALAGVPSSDQHRINVQGNRAYSTAVTLDGAAMHYGQRGQALMQPPPDAVAEVKVITSGAPAEAGRGAAAISLITRRGTNQYHGSLWNYFRNDRLDARSFFAANVPKLRHNQFGGTLGGPVRRGRTFFFGAFEGLESRADAVRSSAFPPAADERAGDFSRGPGAPPRDPLTAAPFPGALIPKDRLDPVALRLADRFPLPNRPGGGYVAQRSVATGSRQALGRLDHDFSPAARTSVRFFFESPSTLEPFPGESNVDGYASSQPQHRTQGANFAHTQTLSPAVLLNARFAYTRFRFSELNTVRETLADLGSKFITAGGPGSLPQITIAGRMSAHSALEVFRKLSDTWEGAADLSWFRASHAVKYGAFLSRDRYWSHQAGRAYGVFTFNGTFSGNAMADFLLGQASQLRQEAVRSNHVRYWSYGAYAQDRWHAAPRLTVTLGLRWEAFTPWRAFDGQFHAFVPGARSRTFPTAPAGVLWQDDPGFPYQADRLNLSPRLGFAYDLSGDGRTSLRGGYGLAYDPLIGQIASKNAQPFGADVTTTNVGPLTDPQRNIDNPYTRPIDLKNPVWTLPWVLTTSFSGPVRAAYTQNANLTLERQIGAGTLVQASWVASLGRKIAIGAQQNPAVYIPGRSTTKNIDERRIWWPVYGSVFGYSTDANSSYHGLHLALNRRLQRGHAVLVSCAWSKAIDEAGANEAAYWTAQDPRDRRGSRGLGDYDVRRRLVASWTWELRGWTLAGIATVQDGMPFTVVSGRDNSLQGVNIPFGADRPDLLGDPRLPARSLDRYFDTTRFAINREGTFGNAGRNILIGPGLAALDLAIRRRFPLRSESRRLELRADFYNALNRANFAAPGAVLAEAASFGRVTSAGPGRIAQLAARLEY